MTFWCLTTSPHNLTTTAEFGWRVQGVKSRRARTAREMAPGDRIVYYVTKAVAFADRQPRRVEVDVGPRQAEHLAAAHAGVDREHGRRREPLAVERGDERADLLAVPGPQRRAAGRVAAVAAA